MGNNKKWVSNEVKNSSSNLKDLFNLKCKYPQFKAIYLKAKASHKRLVENTKSNYYYSKINNSSNRNKTVWNVINELRGKQTIQKAITLNISNATVNDSLTIANTFNEYFINAPNEAIKSISEPNYTLKYPSNNFVSNNIFLSYVTTEDVLDIIRNKIKNKPSCGSDNISGIVIKKFL